jgi:hypothetical protein
MDETDRVHEELSDTNFPVDGQQSPYDAVAGRAKEYESLTEVLRAMIITGCYWGEEQHQDVWRQCLERISDPGGKTSGLKLYLNLKMYPALLLFYAGGLASVAAGNYGNLATLLIRTRGHLPFKNEAPLAHILNPKEILDPNAALHLLGTDQKLYTPVNDYLFQTLRRPLQNLIPRETEYQRYFDRFEYLFALVSGDLYEKLEKHTAWTVGSFIWRDRDPLGFKESVLGDLYREIEGEGESWPGFKSGLFDGSMERFQFIKTKFDEALPRMRESWRIWP